MEEQGEVDGGCMIAVVEQALGNIHRGDTRGLILQAIEHELMTARRVDGEFIDILERLLDIIGIKRGKGSYESHLIAPQREDIGQGAHHDGEIAMIRRHTGEERLQALAHTNRTRAWATTAMRRGEGLVEVDVHDIEAHITRATGSEHGVEVGTVVVHQSASIVDELCNLRDARLEESQGVGVGHHHGSYLWSLLSNDALKIVEIDLTISLRLHLDNLETTDSGRGGVGAMGRVGHDDLLTGQVATRAVVVVDSHQTSEFAMGTCVGLKGEMGQTRELAERLLQHRHQGLGTLHRPGGLFGVQVLELRQSGHLLVDLGVILHGTRTQGIETGIDAKVIVGEVGIMAHHREFVALRQLGLFRAPHGGRHRVVAKVVLRQTVAPAPLFRKFENQISV